jgi:alanine-glyoxylate transaminase / serine-glyoxylate transaminase / serine-pyruvate transaminase
MLMIPGPSEPEPEILAELSLPILPHYGDRWMSVYTETTSLLQKVFKTKNEVIIPPIPGELSVEMAAANLLDKGDEAIICANGVFSLNIIKSVKALGGRPVEVKAEYGTGHTLEMVKAAVDGLKDPAGKPIFIVHNETSTGVCINPADIFRYCKKKGMYTVLDSISGFGGTDLRADEWQVDWAIGYASKAMGGVNGVVPAAVSPAVWELAAKTKGRVHSVFLDLNTWREAIDVDSSWGHPHPTSMPTSVIVALRRALTMALEEGLETRYRRHAEAAKAVRDGYKSMGLDVFTDPKFFSNTVSVGVVDPKWDLTFRKRLVSEYNIMIAGGLGPLRGKVIRVGTMGASARAEKVQVALAAMERVLKEVR